MDDSPKTPPDERSQGPDERMVGILKGTTARDTLRDRLRAESTDAADDLLGRLNALQFLDGVVGEVSEVPTRLGDYTISGLLGRGGMGTVYAAFQESLERDVALKVLSPSFCADPRMRDRFRIEARATASLHHEHIVPVYDFGEASGVLFFAMEKVDGVSLDKHISAARRHDHPAMGMRDAAARFAGVAEALNHAHRRGILHRDVKPGNLLVGPDGTLALADFGLSKIMGDASRSLTRGGGFIGTLSYAPPEQARGEAPSPASDLYSLGVTLFETITGRLPLRGSTTEAMLDQLLNGTPMRLREAVPGAPKDLEAVLAKLLQKNPADRYADGEELARDLQRVAEGEPVRVRRVPLAVRAWRTAKKNRTLSLMVAIAAVLAIVSVTLLVVNQRERSSSASARYDNILQDVMTTAARQVGSALGPPGLVTGLLGVEVDLPRSTDQVMLLLDRAERLDDTDPRGAILRRAYVDDPLPQATQLLRDGRGFRAKQLLDAAIEEAKEGFETRDDATWLRLYRLHLARAVASMTASVAQLDSAKLDLFAASFIRSGAFFPKLLMPFVDWSPDEGAEALVAEVADVVRGGPERAERVAGLLVQAFSGLGRGAGCQWIPVEIPYADRRLLYERGGEMIGGPRQRRPTSLSWTGIESTLAEIARRGIGDRAALEPALTEAFSILAHDVDPASPVQSWSYVLRYLRDPYGITVADEDTALALRALRDLLRLWPPDAFVQSLDVPQITELMQRASGQLIGWQVDGLLAERLRDGDAIEDAANAWLAADPDAPAALLCRFRGHIKAGKVRDARFCASELVQKAVDRPAILAEILDELERAARRDPDRERAKQWTDMRVAFERVAG